MNFLLLCNEKTELNLSILLVVAHEQALLLNHFVQHLSQHLHYQLQHPEYRSLLLILGVNQDRTPKMKATK